MSRATIIFAGAPSYELVRSELEASEKYEVRGCVGFLETFGKVIDSVDPGLSIGLGNIDSAQEDVHTQGVSTSKTRVDHGEKPSLDDVNQAEKVARFFHADHPTLSSTRARWRILPLHPEHLTTDLTQNSWLRAPLDFSSLAASSFNLHGADVPNLQSWTDSCSMSFLTVTGSLREEGTANGRSYPKKRKRDYGAGRDMKRRAGTRSVCFGSEDREATTEADTTDEEEQFVEASFALHENVRSSRIVSQSSIHQSHRRGESSYSYSDSDSDSGVDEDEDATSQTTPSISTNLDLSTLLSPSPTQSTTSSSHFSLPAPPSSPLISHPVTPRKPTHQQLTTRHERPCPRLNPNTPTTPLARLPTATQLSSHGPQTLTTNLLVGIIAINAPRRIVPLRTGRPVDLIEMVVGDDTAAGFAVSFWVDPSEVAGAPTGMKEHATDDVLRTTLSSLRVGDVILLRCIALAQFKGRVYGQSLGRSGGGRASGGRGRGTAAGANTRKKMTARKPWWHTSIRLLYRRGFERRPAASLLFRAEQGPVDMEPEWESDDLENEDEDGYNDGRARQSELSLPSRTEKVRTWVRRFVGPVLAGHNGGRPPRGGMENSGHADDDATSRGRGRKRRRHSDDDAGFQLPPDETQ